MKPIIVMGSVLLALLGACIGPKVRKTHYHRGIEHYDAGSFGEAAREFELAFNEDRANLNALFNLGLSLLENGDYSRAAEFYRTYLQLNPGSAEGHINLAFALAGLGREGEAETHFGRALALDKTHAYPYCSYAQYLLEKRQATADQRALELLDAAVAVEPGDSTAHYLRGLVRERQGDGDAARADFAKAVRLDGENQPALVRLADYELREGDFARAAIHYGSAAVLDSGDVRAWLGVGHCHRHLKQFPNSMRALWRAQQLDPNNERLAAELTLTGLAMAAGQIHYRLSDAGLAGAERSQLETELAQLTVLQQSWTAKLRQMME